MQKPLVLTQSGLSYYIKLLVDSGLLASSHEGKWTHYRLNGAGRDHAVKLLLAITTPDAEREGGCLSCDR